MRIALLVLGVGLVCFAQNARHVRLEVQLGHAEAVEAAGFSPDRVGPGDRDPSRPTMISAAAFFEASTLLNGGHDDRMQSLKLPHHYFSEGVGA